MRKGLIFYHRVDGDGLCSCLIAKQYLEWQGYDNITCFGFNYGDPENTIDISGYDIIILVDISLSPTFMLSLKEKCGQVIWIDHHITAILESERSGYSDLPGIRSTEQGAACELAWSYFFPENTPTPDFIRYLGIYDTWRKTDAPWDDTILPIQYALRNRYGLKLEEWENSVWPERYSPTFLLGLIEEGRLILGYLKKTWYGWMQNSAFPVQVAGKYKGICILTPMFGSSMFESVLDEYDIYITVGIKKNSEGVSGYSLSMYHEPDRLPEFSCGEYLKSKYTNAGGHPGAAGCSDIGLEEFTRLLKEKTI